MNSEARDVDSEAGSLPVTSFSSRLARARTDLALLHLSLHWILGMASVGL